MPPPVLGDDEFQQLQSIVNSCSLPHSIVQLAQIVLDNGAGETNTAIAARMGLTCMSYCTNKYAKVRSWQRGPTPIDSTRWGAGLGSSSNGQSVAAASPASKS